MAIRKISLLVFFLFSSFSSFVLSHQVKKIEVGFSPGKSAIQLILKSIKNAKKKIDIAAYSFTSKPIAVELVNARERGVLVRILADKKSNKSKYTALNYLSNQNISVRLNNQYSIMHNKFMIIDDSTIETGSFNYTKNAAFHNAENVVVLHEIPKIAIKYIMEFNRLWKESEALERGY